MSVCRPLSLHCSQIVRKRKMQLALKVFGYSLSRTMEERQILSLVIKAEDKIFTMFRGSIPPYSGPYSLTGNIYGTPLAPAKRKNTPRFLKTRVIYVTIEKCFLIVKSKA